MRRPLTTGDLVTGDWRLATGDWPTATMKDSTTLNEHALWRFDASFPRPAAESRASCAGGVVRFRGHRALRHAVAFRLSRPRRDCAAGALAVGNRRPAAQHPRADCGESVRRPLGGEVLDGLRG